MKLKIFVEDDKRKRNGKAKPKQTGKKPAPKKPKQEAKPAKPNDAEKKAKQRAYWARRKAMEKKNANAPNPPTGGNE